MIRTCIFIPVSRTDHLDRLFASLELLECSAEATTLLTYVDGGKTLYDYTNRLTQASKFAAPTCVWRKGRLPFPSHSLLERRTRISAIKNESKAYIPDSQYVFGIEDDTIVPPHALEQLLDDYAAYPHAGFIEGVELGRWGIPYIGAWRTDNPWSPSVIESVLPDGAVECMEIDAGGFYCYLTTRDLYRAFDYRPFGNNTLGPDVAYGLYLRQNGYQNYIDWRVSCEHRTRQGKGITIANSTPRVAAMVLKDGVWCQELRNM